MGKIVTNEGLDLCLAIQYYSRMRLTTNLSPLLRGSSHPRILSVQNGGSEQAINELDIGLQDPKNYSWSSAVSHISTMTSLSFSHLSELPENKNITFIHSAPGLVRTEIFSRLKPSPESGFLARLWTVFFRKLMFNVQWYMGVSIADCGARQAYLLTSEAFGPGKLWRIDQESEPVTMAGVLEGYEKNGWGVKVWEFTTGVVEKALRMGE